MTMILKSPDTTMPLGILNHQGRSINIVFFIDEGPLNLHIKRNYGRSPSGTRANVIIPTYRGRIVHQSVL